MYESTDIDEPLLQARDRVGNGMEILTYCAGFCTATNSDKLSEHAKVSAWHSLISLNANPSSLM